MAEFEETLASTINSSVEVAWSTTILTNGAEFLPNLLEEIKNAKKTILITNFIWEDGEFGNTIFDALIEKAREWIEVRILLDGVGGVKASEKHIKELSALGWEIVYFRPLTWWNINRVARRNHIRDIVIDGRIGYLGGIAIADLWLGNAETPDSWHDYMFKVDGQTAVRLESVFHHLWSQTTGGILHSDRDNSINPDGKNTPRFISLLSSPSPDMSSSMEHFIWMSIAASKKSIHIENPYLLPSKSILEALKNKAREGIDVSIIIPGKSDAPYIRWASNSYYKDMLQSWIKIYEYQPSRLHAKTMVFDRKWSIIGSANLDNRSSRINLEFILWLDDKELAENLETQFTEDLKKSREVTKEAQQKRSIFFLPLELIARLFSHQY